jgi:peptide/nickel transport system permease protein
MARYVIRRLRPVVLGIVAALTFILFRVIPTGNPAVLRAGRDPQPKLIHEIEHVPARQVAADAVLGFPKGVFLHFEFGYSYFQPESVIDLIKERAARDDLG